jgi:hypothetical protein
MHPHADAVLALRMRADQAIVPQKPPAELLRVTWTSDQPLRANAENPCHPCRIIAKVDDTTWTNARNPIGKPSAVQSNEKLC